MSSLLEPQSQPEESAPWALIAGGFVAMLLVVGVIYLLSRPAEHAPQTASPYAEKLQLSDFKMSTAQNFMGSTVTYLEGKVTNSGDQTVIHATVEVTFQNSLQQVVQQESPPLTVLQERPGYSDAMDLNMAPLAAGQSRTFRLTFEHISEDWDRQVPRVRVVAVQTR